MWLNRKLKKLDISLIFANNGFQSPVSETAIRYNQISGTHVEYAHEKKWLMLKGYYQSGDDGITGKKISAFLIGSEFMYKLSAEFSLAVGFEYLSGQSQTDTSATYKNAIHNFTPYYGTGHKFNGYMDYFYAGSSHGGVGLQNYYLRLKFIKKKIFFYLEPHYFLSASDILDYPTLSSTGAYKSMPTRLGFEADFSFGYTPSQEVSFRAGYSQMFASKSMEVLKGGNKNDVNNWSYIMIIIKPNLIP